MSHRSSLVFALSLLLALALGACNRGVSQADLVALEALPQAERVAKLEALWVRYPDDVNLPDLLAKARWEDYADMEGTARIEAVKAELREDPENSVTSKLLGDAYYDYSRSGGGVNYLDSALFAYENAALKDPNFLGAVGSVGSLYDEKEDFGSAIEWYQKALELDPDHVPTLCNIGASHYNQGDYAVAMDYYRQALALDPDSQDAHYNMGVAFAEATIYREAIHEWNQVVAADSTTAVAKQAAKNAELLQDVLDETVYKNGRKSRRLNTENTE
jgi:tetratricopeptide (TPR) repeat protein